MEKDVLLLSGIQHFSFCKRQWALIHIEHQWSENERTAKGQVFHQGAHEGPEHELRGDILIVRGLRIKSEKLCISGICDVVEFHKNPTGVPLFGYDGLWLPYPVEYKRGVKKASDCDRLQLCAQAICLEEMLACSIPEGSLYYGETHRREKVTIDNALRTSLLSTLSEMHRLYQKGITPPPVYGAGCRECSMKDDCMPKIHKAEKINDYIQRCLED